MPKCSEFMFVHLLMYFIQNVTPGILGKHRANKSNKKNSQKSYRVMDYSFV